VRRAVFGETLVLRVPLRLARHELGLERNGERLGTDLHYNSWRILRQRGAAVRIHPFLPISLALAETHTVPALPGPQLNWSTRYPTFNLASPSLFAFSRSVQQNGHFTPVTKGYPRFDFCSFCR
jgi:hypothetical protein